MEEPGYFPSGTWSVNYEWYRETAVWARADTSHFKIGSPNPFSRYLKNFAQR